MVAEQLIAAIGSGPLTLLGVENGDRCDRHACKVVALRIFEEDAGRKNSFLVDSGGREDVGRQPMHAVRRYAQGKQVEFYQGGANGRCPRPMLSFL